MTRPAVAALTRCTPAASRGVLRALFMSGTCNLIPFKPGGNVSARASPVHPHSTNTQIDEWNDANGRRVAEPANRCPHRVQRRTSPRMPNQVGQHLHLRVNPHTHFEAIKCLLPYIQ